ncbi:MAG: DUF4350 domain-containing protein [Erythrobacter sp.]|nr:DUF4350 domain-containing protein [Erythrobacter sp.]
MSRAASPFRPGVVLALLVVGAGAFLLLLYALGQGWTGDSQSDGGSHAAADGLNGYSGLVQLLEGTGHDVELSRSQPQDGDYNLMVLTPPMWSNPEEVNDVITARISRANGPTLVILPKWIAFDAAMVPGLEGNTGDGWVLLAGAQSPPWFAQTQIGEGTQLAIGATSGWNGMAQSGSLPDQEQVQALTGQQSGNLQPLVVDGEGDVLVAQYVDKSSSSYDAWPVVVVFEPDLFNNYGMADEDRARLALDVIALASENEDLPIDFDLSMHGMGSSDNLLTLAFEPPFLAATLCLILAALVIAWRAFRRFGPPMAEAAAVVQGKRQLALNGAALLERVKRWHLLKKPYEDMVSRRLAHSLGLRASADTDTREGAIDHALASRGLEGPPFSRLAHDLRVAERPRDILRAARALRNFERTVTR